MMQRIVNTMGLFSGDISSISKTGRIFPWNRTFDIVYYHAPG